MSLLLPVRFTGDSADQPAFDLLELGENEFPDTIDDNLPEKGWVRLVLTRLIEDHLGYSSTCQELTEAIKSSLR